jgi:uncharacterized iron-regulated membrane protein
MRLKRLLARVHRWLSLAIMALWLVQALTGMLSVFHWELDDAMLPGSHHATDLAAIDRRLAQLAPPGSGRSIGSVWTSAGKADRWDVSVDGPAGPATARIDGAGNILRIHSDDERLTDGGWIETLVILHQTLLSGDTGSWIIGLSGCLLLSNMIFGLVIAWPRAGAWRRSLRPAAGGRAPARLYGWHRAMGLWAAVPALLLVSAGVARVFSDGFERLIGAPVLAVPPVAPRGPGISFSRAAGAALARHPNAELAGVNFPGADNAVWKVRLRAPGEAVRAYGNTTVFIDGNDGHVLADDPIDRQPAVRRIADWVYPIHTGEIGGLPGRLAVLLLGIWLASMIVIGGSLWWVRRPMRKGKAG